MDPEDKDGFEDADGCPDPDNDKDGIEDTADKCPNRAEDKDGFEDADGCPDFDNDQDTVLDAEDKCPNTPEDQDGYQDEDGCPDPDNDKDGIPDLKDECPLMPETVNKYQDEDGCPDSSPKAKVQVTKHYIKIKGKVHFATGKAKIKRKSFKLLVEVATVLKRYPKITKLRIEGHTDSRGSASSNKRLSDARAKAVRAFLIDAGVAADRLVAVGYGEERPKASNKTRKGRAENRRVDFYILEYDGHPVAPDAEVEAK